MRLPSILLVAAVIVPIFACQKDKPSTGTSSTSIPTTGVPTTGGGSPGPALASAIAAQAKADLGNTEASVQGTSHSTGGELGTSDVKYVDCQSGERNGFFGADFYVAGSDTLRLRYVHDEAAGDVVKLAVPSNAGTFLVLNHDTKCTVLEGSVAKTNIKTWTPKGDIRHVEGHVKFDCPQPDGKARVSGELTFSHCH